jgi:hypothetical protein
MHAERHASKQSGVAGEAGSWQNAVGNKESQRGKCRTAALFWQPTERSQSMAQYEHVPCHVVDARYLGDYKVWLEFNDGRKGVVDLADELYGDEFESLRDRDRFAEFVLDYGLATIAWENGVDFAPDYLYERLNAVH